MQAATRLVRLAGERRADPAAGLAWGRHAEVALEHGGGGDAAAATLWNGLAVVHVAAGDAAKARELGEQALAVWERDLGDTHPSVASSLNNLGNVVRLQGDLAAAEELVTESLHIRERALGEDHTLVSQSVGNLAVLAARQGHVVLVPATAHRRCWRDLARIAAPRFAEVFVATPAAECAERDPKGLYRRRVDELPGADIPYEVPTRPDVVAPHGLDASVVDSR